jgi:DNA-binding transcriptional ArsR family regulator
MKAGAGRGKETVATTVDDDSDLVNDDRAVLAAPFTCIPLWVLEADISSAAKLLYAGLNSFVAGKGGSCTVKRRTLSARIGLSVATIGRALKDLVRIGALVIKERQGADGGRLANEYILLFDSPAVREEVERAAGRVPESLVLGDPAEPTTPAIDSLDSASSAPLFVLNMVAEKKLTPTNLFVYLAARGLSDSGYCAEGFAEEIAKQTGMEKRGVYRHLKALREAGAVEVRTDCDKYGYALSVYVFPDAADGRDAPGKERPENAGGRPKGGELSGVAAVNAHKSRETPDGPASSAEPSQPAAEAPPEPPQKPHRAPKGAAVSNPLFVEFKDVYGRVKPAEGAAVEKAWLRVVQDRDPREMRAKAERLLEKTRDYVEVRMREKDPVARVKFTKSPVNFLSDGFWEAVPPAPAQPEVGKVYFDEGPRVPLSERDVYPSWKAAAEGDEGAIKAAKRRMRSGVTVPDAAVVQYPALIDIFGLECDKYAPEEVQAVFRSLGKPVPGEEPATESDDEAADGGGSLFADLGASMRADMGPAGLEADPADGMSTYDAGRFLT